MMCFLAPLFWGCPGTTPCTGTSCETPDKLESIPEGYCETFYENHCTWSANCGLYSSKQACLKSSLEEVRACNERVNELAQQERPKQQLNQARSKKCFDFLTSATPQCSLLRFIDACYFVIDGARAIGETCEASSDCSDDGRCVAASINACPGVCISPMCDEGQYLYDGQCRKPVARGGSCAPLREALPAQQCELDTFCEAGTFKCRASGQLGEACGDWLCEPFVLVCSNGFCRRLKGPGEPCEGSYDCKGDFLCGEASPGQPKTCLSGAVIGESCASSPCLEGSCDPLTRICSRPPREPVKVSQGQPCKFDTQCVEGHHCPYSSKVCTVQSKMGEPCESQSACLNGLRCDYRVGTCHSPREAGGRCSVNEDCIQGYACIENVCSTPRAAGQTCHESWICQENLFCNESEICVNKFPLGQTCSDSRECYSGVCDSVSKTCAEALCR